MISVFRVPRAAVLRVAPRQVVLQQELLQVEPQVALRQVLPRPRNNRYDFFQVCASHGGADS